MAAAQARQRCLWVVDFSQRRCLHLFCLIRPPLNWQTRRDFSETNWRPQHKPPAVSLCSVTTEENWKWRYTVGSQRPLPLRPSSTWAKLQSARVIGNTCVAVQKTHISTWFTSCGCGHPQIKSDSELLVSLFHLKSKVLKCKKMCQCPNAFYLICLL